MSYQFTVTAIYVTTKPAADVDHDGKPLVNADYPVGTVLGIDKAGHMFVHVGPTTADDFKSFGRMHKNQTCFRDYWRHVMEPKQVQCTDRARGLSPFNRAILAAGLELIAGTAVPGL